MTSLAPSKTSGRLLALISAGILQYANSALAAEPVLDPQGQARQFIVAKPNFGVATDSKAQATAVVAAQDNDRVDPQEQARRFILAKPSLNGLAGRVVAPVAKTKVMSTVSARSNRGG